MDGMLSQEEINALLSGMNTDSNDTKVSESEVQDQILTEEETDVIGEISNISLGTAATTLSSLVNQKVVITTPKVSVSTWEELANSYGRPCVFIQIYYKQGLEGNNILILKEDDVKIIADLMMGGDGTNVSEELTELHLSAISEAMNQMMGSSSTSLSSILDKKVDISPPAAQVVDLNSRIRGEDLATFLRDPFIKVSFKMEIGNLVDSELMQLYPVEFTKDLYRKFTSTMDFGMTAHADAEPKINDINIDQSANATGMDMQPQDVQIKMDQMGQVNMGQMNMNDMNMGQMNMNPMNMSQMSMGQMNMNPMNMSQMNGWPMGNPMMSGQPQYAPYQAPPVQEVNVQPAQFTAFNTNQAPTMHQENINLLRDVPLEVTVELGRTSKSIKEILEFTPGTIIELNRLAGEPIDVLVNGKYVAKGEVVVIEEAFGIRVTEIIK